MPVSVVLRVPAFVANVLSLKSQFLELVVLIGAKSN